MPTTTTEPTWIAEVLSTLPALATVEEAAAALRMSPRNLRRKVSLRQIGFLKAPGDASRLLFPRAAIAAYLASIAAGL